MKLVIIGAVAGGTSAAAKARRNSDTAEIKIFDSDGYISYSSCGLPYYIGEEIESMQELIPRDPIYFKKKYNIDMFIKHRVISIDIHSKTLSIEDMTTNTIFTESYDRLIIATGAKTIMPNIEGLDKPNVLSLRNIISGKRIKDYIDNNKPKKAVIIGSGFIGLEMVENLKNTGMDVTVIEMAAQIMPVMDNDMSKYIEDYLIKKGVNVVLNDSVVKIEGNEIADKVILKSGKTIDTDIIIMSVGVKPQVELAKAAGIEIGITGAIAVNNRMQTNISDIYACGDCAESFSLLTKKPIYRPLGTTANKMGRIAGDQVTGGALEFRGILGTAIFKIFDMAVAQTGLTEKEALKEGYEIVISHIEKLNKANYLDGQEMVLKAIADKNTGTILGVQIVGYEGVDKRIDIIATAMTYGAKAEDLFHLDLAYAPHFSTAKDPVSYVGMALENAINKGKGL